MIIKYLLIMRKIHPHTLYFICDAVFYFSKLCSSLAIHSNTVTPKLFGIKKKKKVVERLKIQR